MKTTIALCFGLLAICSRVSAAGEATLNESSNTQSSLTTNLSTQENSNVGRHSGSNWLYAVGAATNGLACGLVPLRDGENRSLAVLVYAVNTTSNVVSGCIRPSLENVLDINAFDSAGKPIEKTTLGSKFGRFMSTGQIEKWHRNNRQTSYYQREGAYFIPPPGCQLGRVPLRELFEFTKPGDYTIRVKLCVIHRGSSASVGSYELLYLPEVSAVFRLDRSDIRTSAEVAE